MFAALLDKDTTHVSPVAEMVIAKCGGVKRVAEICGRSESAVYKWTYPKDRAGRGGVVPHEDAEKLLKAAKKGIVPVTPEDFFEND